MSDSLGSLFDFCSATFYDDLETLRNEYVVAFEKATGDVRIAYLEIVNDIELLMNKYNVS